VERESDRGRGDAAPEPSRFDEGGRQVSIETTNIEISLPPLLDGVVTSIGIMVEDDTATLPRDEVYALVANGRAVVIQ
jgi:hypothetical protein